MATESGHSINLGHYKELIDYVSQQSSYLPTNPLILVAAMTAQWTTADGLQTDLNAAISAAMEPINIREEIFAALYPTLTRTVNYYGSSGVSKRSYEDALRIKVQISGVRKKKETTTGEGEDSQIKRISNSHRSFLKQTENLEALILFYEDNPTYYKPNEVELKTAALRTTLIAIKAANSAMDTLLNAIITARTKRNYALYNIKDGIYDVQLACKKYVRGLFGAKSQEAKAVGKIRFTRFMKVEKV